MLETLHVHDLALIERAELRLAAGLTVVSGATGGGKSLLVQALDLLRGGRAGAQLVRHGAAELRIDGEFRLEPGARREQVAALLAAHGGGALDDDVLLITRAVDAAGRSRARVNGRPATLGLLRDLGALLLEIHGQGEARALQRPDAQCEALDAFAGCAVLRRDFAAALAAARQARASLQQAIAGERERRQRIDFLRFQQRAMVELALGDGELAALEQEHQVLQNLDALRQRLGAALGALQDGEHAAADALAQAGRAVQEAAALDPRLSPAAELLAQAEEQVADVCRLLQSGQARLDLDPGALAAVRERLDEIHGALRRYGPTEADLRANLERVTAELAAEEAAADHAALAAALQQAMARAAALAADLHAARLAAAAPFAAAIEAELRDLGMAHADLRVAMADAFAPERLLDDATALGPVAVDFEVRCNAGEPFRSLRATASGGELARIVLALEKTLADRSRVPLLVFDEIDAEIGGRLGLAVGEKLRALAQHRQVLVVTHLAPVAAFAQRHVLVGKQAVAGADGERTAAFVRQLAGEEVEAELAAMAVGEGADAAAVRQARRLVATARTRAAAG